MSFTVQHKRSAVEGHRPLSASLVDGQLGVNYNNNTPGLFFKTGTDQIVKVGPAAVSQSAPTLDTTSGYCVGELWLNITSNNDILNVWDGSQWRDVKTSSTQDLGSLSESLIPAGNCLHSLGTLNNKWSALHACDVFAQDMYAGDIHLTNKERGGNDVDGTWGDYTIQEGEESLFLINNRSNQKYRFVLESVSPE